jgi:hypothetical protein
MFHSNEAFGIFSESVNCYNHKSIRTTCMFSFPDRLSTTFQGQS